MLNCLKKSLQPYVHISFHSDTMFELRTLRHGVRPVTGHGHRQTLEDFMNKLAKSQEKPQENKQNVPSNRDDVEEHRPDAVVVEVQGLFQERRVSSLLQSAEFRRQLEGIICNSVSRSIQNPSFLSQQNFPPPESQSSSAIGISNQTGHRSERSHSPREENTASFDSSSSQSITATSASTSNSSSSSTTSNRAPGTWCVLCLLWLTALTFS